MVDGKDIRKYAYKYYGASIRLLARSTVDIN